MTSDHDDTSRELRSTAGLGETDSAGDHARAEYDALYREIADNSTRIYTVLSVCVTATTVFLGYFLPQVADQPPGARESAIEGAATSADPLPFILLILVVMLILPCMLLVESSAHSTVRIAGYLAVFYEGPGKVNWQSRLQQFRVQKGGSQGRRFGFGLRSIFDGLSAVVLTCAVWSASRLWTTDAFFPTWVWFIVLCFLVGGMHFAFRTRLKRTWSNENFLELQNDWRGLAERE